MSYMVKVASRLANAGGEGGTLARTRATTDLAGVAGSLARQVSGGLEATLRKRPGLKSSVGEAVVAIIAGEVRFISSQTKPEAAVVRCLQSLDSQVDAFGRALAGLVESIIKAVPADDGEAGVLAIEVPLISLARDPQGLMQGIAEAVLRRHFDSGKLELGAGMAADLFKRMCRVSGLTAEEACARPAKVKWPRNAGSPPVEMVRAFFGDSPLGKLLTMPVKMKVSDRVRSEHMLITAGAGHGKSQTLQHMIASDLARPKGAEVGMVVVDSQGDLISRIARLQCFATSKRLLIVDASDVEYPVALNLFDLGGLALKDLPPREREQMKTANVQLATFVLGALFGSELTAKQGTVFGYVVELMLSIKGATIHTLRECLEEPREFMADIERLSPTARAFFVREFMGKEFSDTRKQLLRRLYGVLRNSSFERMFASKSNRLDLYAALNQGKVVLCNTSREFLGDECRVFGRYCIALAMKAAFDRARIPQEQRRNAFLYVDEASDYFDESIEQLLVQARKYKLGVVLAHQALEQMSDGMRAIVMSNTSIKLAGGVSGRDARYLATELRSSDEFILRQEKDDSGTRFATFVRNVTPGAVPWRLPFGTMERMGRMSDAAYAAMIARIRSEVSAGAVDFETLDAVNDDSRGDDFSESY